MRGHSDECPRCGRENVWLDELHDARGIYCGSACQYCMPGLEAEYRPEVLSDPQYVCDEPIEPEES